MLRLRAWVSGLLLLLNPKRLKDVFVLEEATSDSDAALGVARRAGEHAAGARAIAERYRLPPVDLAALGALPEGTLGRTFADRMREMGLDPGALPRKAAQDDVQYVRAHLYETHDLWHVVLGFGVDVAGELGVQAAYAAQHGGALPRLLITGGLLQGLIFARQDWPARLEAVARGYDLARRAHPLFGVRWHELYAEPLERVRERLALAAA
ncbi:MAG TPA: Coq4 family protein [Myxococcota bacterium]|nr:Coq4 family protein [Myxococcota bacterium]